MGMSSLQRPSLKSVIDEVEKKDLSTQNDTAIRQMAQESSKDFKLSWVNLGRVLYTVWKDKLFKVWGYEKFETYITKEVGIRKATAVKLLRSYFFLEKEEPRYLSDNYGAEEPAAKIAEYETVNVLRNAKEKKDITRSDYQNLKEAVFQKGKDATLVRKDLTQLMKQRKEVDPEVERDKRAEASVRRFVNAFRSFKHDMEVLKLIPAHLVRQAEEVVQQIERESL